MRVAPAYCPVLEPAVMVIVRVILVFLLAKEKIAPRKKIACEERQHTLNKGNSLGKTSQETAELCDLSAI